MTQRIAGAWLSIFTACVVLNHFLQANLSWYDAVYCLLLVPLVASSFVEAKVFKVFQVSIILLTGVLMLVQEDVSSRPVGMVIMAFSQMFAYTYGFLSKHQTTKLLVFGSIYLTLFVLSIGNIGNSIMWVFMCFTIHGGIWLCARELIEKARRLDELERQALKQTILVNETLLRETVDAGMVLVQEIKSKESKDGCEE